MKIIHRCMPYQLHRSAWRAAWRGWWVLLAWLGLTQAALAASVPTGFIDRQVASGLTSPSSMAVLPDGRVLVVQQDGVIRIIKSDALLPTNFYTVASVDAFSERGCLGIVPDPGFASNHHVYIYCTVTAGSASHNRVLRVTEANDTAAPGSERVIFDLPDVPTGTKWHMGGAMRFGVDGKLYIAVGNHEDNPQPVATSHAQNLASAFGKLLRINADGTIPSDNPFFNTPGAYRANYLLGLRNPFVFDIQPGTGLMYIGDVGQASWEEVNQGQAGGNYGWPAVEGMGTDARYLNPIYAYAHNQGCAITGTAFYNPSAPQFPPHFVGQFFFADFCNGSIQHFASTSPLNPSTLATGIGNPTHIAVAPDGSLYYLARNQATGTPAPGAGTVGKISYTGSLAPSITEQPQDQTVYIGTPATFSIAAQGAQSYQWQRNGFDISGATAGSYTLASTSLADDGALFRVVLSNASGNVTSNEAELTVTSNRAPIARIDTPTVGTQFASGEAIAYSGGGSDPEDGSLPPSALSWKVDFQHDAHAHAFIPPLSGVSSGSFTVPDFEASEANTWMRITLTASDSSGASQAVTRDIYPKTQISSLAPAGLPTNGWGPYEIDRSNGESAAGDGRTLSLGNIAYAHGLGMHAPAEIRFNLYGACSGNLVTDIGVDDEVGDLGSVVFQVYLDGVKAYDSGTVTGSALRKNVNLSVANKNELRLVVTDAADGKDFDHADWAGARITGCGPLLPPASITNLQVFDSDNASKWSVRSNAQVGNTVYGDRSDTFASLPANLVGTQWIRTAQASRTYSKTPLATFRLTAAADVYIALDNGSAPPAWIDDSWVDTATVVRVAQNGGNKRRTSSVLKKRFPAGNVNLGPFKGADRFYTVFVK